MQRFFRYLGFTIIFALLGAGVAFSFWPQNLNYEIAKGLLIESDYDSAAIGVVLGGGLLPTGQVSDVSAERVDKAVEIYGQDYVDFIFSGGEFPRGIEAVAMNDYAKSKGYDGLDHLEAASTSTYENAKFSEKLLEAGEISAESLVVITSPWHARRAKATFIHEMPNRKIEIAFPDDSVVFNDSIPGRWKGVYLLVREYLATYWYAFKYDIHV